jgi:hypothetical protein
VLLFSTADGRLLSVSDAFGKGREEHSEHTPRGGKHTCEAARTPVGFRGVGVGGDWVV